MSDLPNMDLPPRRPTRQKKVIRTDPGLTKATLARQASVNERLLAEVGMDMDEYLTLDEAERAVFLQAVQEYVETGESITAASLVDADYKWAPVSCEQFLSDPYYLGDFTKELYPLCRKVLIDVFDGDVVPVDVILGGSIGWGKCLRHDTLVATGRGLLTVKAAAEADGVQVLTHLGHRARARFGSHPGISQTKRITTRWGYEIEGRGEHRAIVYVDGRLEWRRFDEIRPGDLAVLQRGTHMYGADATLTAAAAYGLGVFTGVETGAHPKRIPQCVLSAPMSVQAAFLRGLFDTDGTCGHGRIEYCTVSDRLAYEVQTALLNMGVAVSRRRKQVLYRYKGSASRRPAWVIRVVGKASVRAFAAHVGFDHPTKSGALTALLSSVDTAAARPNDQDVVPAVGALLPGSRWRRQPNLQRATLIAEAAKPECPQVVRDIADRDLLLLPVESVEDDEADCWDLSVPGDESYIAAGFLSHNTTLGAAGILYDIYRVSCLRNPHEYYGLMPGAKIAFALFSTSMSQAADSAFGKLLTWVDGSPYFKERMPRVKGHTTRMVFTRSPILVVTGSQEVHTIGKDMYGFLLDEANFLNSKNAAEDAGRAHEMYSNAKNRMTSRFQQAGGRVPGKCWLISSKRTYASFLENHIASSKKDIDSGLTRVFEFSRWQVLPASKFILPRFRVEVGDRINPSRILKDENTPRPGADVIIVPGEYLPNFEKDIDQAMRDIAGIASYGMLPLFHDRNVLLDHEVMVKDIVHPFTKDEISTSILDDVDIGTFFRPEVMFQVRQSRYALRRNPLSPRFIHVDIGLTADAMGIACVHQSGWKKVRRPRVDGTYFDDKAPIIDVDFMLRITPPKGSEIDLGKMRGFIINLRDYGLPIWRVTLDGYQCFTSDTRVRLLDGTAASMADLSARYGRSEVFWVYAFDRRTGRVVPGRARNARRTGSKPIAVVTLDNGEAVRCTHDHRWLMRDGSYVEARDLRPGDSLMPLYTRVPRNHRVVSVVLTDDVEDVYDIEVDEHHNFALDAGVFVHNSRDTMQILRKMDFDAVLYSVDKTDEAYLSLRQAVVEKRIRYYRYETMLRECFELERNLEKNTVDHPQTSPTTGGRGSKDVSDAVAGATYNCLIDPQAAVSPSLLGDPVDNMDSAVKTPHGSLPWEDLERELRT